MIHKDQIKITGSHLTLSVMTSDDLSLKVRWYNDPQVRQSLIVDELFELDKTRQWYEAVKDSPSRLDLMIYQSDGRAIGLAGLVNINDHDKTAEIVLVIGEKDYWGKGVMYEAERLLMGWAFETLGLEKIWAHARSDNIASIITMKKLGFQIEGTLRKHAVIGDQRVDIFVLGLLRSEFNLTSQEE